MTRFPCSRRVWSSPVTHGSAPSGRTIRPSFVARAPAKWPAYTPPWSVGSTRCGEVRTMDNGVSARPEGRSGGMVIGVACLIILVALVGCGSNEPTQSGSTDPQDLTGVEWHLDDASVESLVPDVPQS